MREALSEKEKFEIAKRIKKYRKDNWDSKSEFAKFLGMSNQYYNTVEEGENCLSIKKIRELCNKTGLSADWLLLGKASNMDEELMRFLSKYEKEELEIIFEMIRAIMKRVG